MVLNLVATTSKRNTKFSTKQYSQHRFFLSYRYCTTSGPCTIIVSTWYPRTDALFFLKKKIYIYIKVPDTELHVPFSGTTCTLRYNCAGSFPIVRTRVLHTCSTGVLSTFEVPEGTSKYFKILQVRSKALYSYQYYLQRCGRRLVRSGAGECGYKPC